MKNKLFLLILLVFISTLNSAEDKIKGISSRTFNAEKKILPPKVNLPPQLLMLKNESAMVHAGMSLAVHMKPELSEEVKKVMNIILKDYDDLQKDKEFAELPGMLPGTEQYKKLKGKGHYFLYVPQSWKQGKETDFVIFLHGFGGNFKVYPWWWKDACEKNGWIAVFPTFGIGFWRNAGSDTLIKGVIQNVRTLTGMKKGRVFLAGISNGTAVLADLLGKGVRADGLIVISGGLPDLTVIPEEKRIPVLILVGNKDWAYTNSTVTALALKQKGHQVTLKEYSGEGHFLMARRKDVLMNEISKWMGKPKQESMFSYFKADLNQHVIQGYSRDEKGKPSFNKIRDKIEKGGGKLYAAVNGGIFQKNGLPLGLYVENGMRKQKLNTKNGVGNFYIKPNGVFYVSGLDAGIAETSEYRKKETSPVLAVQSGPLLVYNGRINPVFSKKSENRFIRSGVGVDSNGAVYFLISNKAVSFYDFSVYFKDTLKCDNALYLDGVISKMFAPSAGRNDDGVFPVVIGVSRRKR